MANIAPCTALERAVALHEASVALLDSSRALSYGELDSLASAMADHLQDLGVRAGARVAICAAKRVETIACMYGCWKLGACYVPIDPTLPTERKERLLAQCAPAVLVTDADVPVCRFAGPALNLRGFSKPTVNRGRVRAPVTPSCDDDAVAAILYTSGSTGQPKGTALTHRNLAVFTSWAVSKFDLGAADRFLSHAPLHFDLSFFDLFAAVACSASVLLLDAREVAQPLLVAQRVVETGVSIWQSVPFALTMQAACRAKAPAMPSVRHVLFAGERMPRATVEALQGVFPRAAAHNVYGCTEANDTLIYTLPPDPRAAPDPLPIGTPLPHVQVRVVDAAGVWVQAGESGELWVSSETLMQGYVCGPRSDDIERGSHVIDGFYRTRDVVVEDSQGVFHFLGRVDDWVKVRGQRVNLMEVEDHLRTSQHVRDVAVLSVSDPVVGTKIVAIVAPEEPSDIASLELALRRHCQAVLPAHAIPHSIRAHTDVLPKTATGKIDRRALQQLVS
ncbi:MAG: hypothetical protein RL701_486 [Pseudomonadota bacterium]|jgi:amino acid adenylation domain-containing protein